MNHGAEAFKHDYYPPDEPEPEQRKTADIIPFPSRPKQIEQTEKYSDNYQKYRALGGIINEADYTTAFARLREVATASEKLHMASPELIAQFADIELSADDPRATLYGILRADVKPDGVEHHHSQMSDQRLFVEALRMLGDTDAVNEMIQANHKVGIYCPLCANVVAEGDRCV